MLIEFTMQEAVSFKEIHLTYNGNLIIGPGVLYLHSFALTLSSVKQSSQPIKFEYHLTEPCVE